MLRKRTTKDRWIKIEIHGHLPAGTTLNLKELPASLGLERVVLVTAVELEQLKTDE